MKPSTARGERVISRRYSHEETKRIGAPEDTASVPIKPIMVRGVFKETERRINVLSVELWCFCTAMWFVTFFLAWKCWTTRELIDNPVEAYVPLLYGISAVFGCALTQYVWGYFADKIRKEQHALRQLRQWDY